MDDPTGMMDIALDVLVETFHLASFRLVQEQIIRRLLVNNESALCIMPTGGGKSLTYQLPALILPGLTIVISPLLSLMKDQVDALKLLGIAAAEMNSSSSLSEMTQTREALNKKTLKLLYVAPERLNNETFIAQIREYCNQGGVISLLAVDEAHCISSWGHSFRPDYCKIARFAEEIEAERILCLTATAAPEVVEDITYGFNIKPEGVFRTGVFRPNLTLKITPCKTMGEKLDILVPFLKSRKSSSIVYITTQQDAEDGCAALKARGIDCKFYHAGIPADERKLIQNWFMTGTNGVIVATIAFGLGIDKASIGQIIHLNTPKTLEGYSQEVGRAGRDGKPATCLMLPSESDLPLLESFARGNTPSPGAIRKWLLVIFSTPPDSDGTLSFNQYEQSTTFDIKAGTLGLLNASLELENELIRAITPYYAIYKIKASNFAQGWNQIMGEKSLAAIALKNGWSKGPTWMTIDMVAVARSSGIERIDLARTISRWEAAGLCECQVSGVRARFAILKKLPTNGAEIDAIADGLFDQLSKREEADVTRLNIIGEFISGAECYAYALAKYFEGATTSVPNNACGLCSYCSTKQVNTFTSGRSETLDENSIKQVLNVCGVRDDARFLARLAFGITSPRITTLGLSKNPIFGICSKASFSELIKRFSEECSKVGGKNRADLAPAKPPAAKRPFGGSTGNSNSAAKKPRGGGSSSSSSRGGRGRGGWGSKN